MCRPDATTIPPRRSTTTTTTNNNNKKSSTRLLLSLKSYDFGPNNTIPNLSSCLLTGTIFVAFLAGMERFVYHLLTTYGQEYNTILQNDVNRQILARHIGVDAFSCFIVAYLGLQTSHVCQNVIHAAFNDKKKKKVEEDTTTKKTTTKKKKDDNNDNDLLMPKSAHETRLYTYHPAAFRVALFFFFYQIKNLYDTIKWNDGPEFIFHHIFSLFTAWGSMKSCVGLYYAIFFFGISEVSTGILCILANFDDEYGVKGLGDAFPMIKVSVGFAFIVAFMVCRSILWPIYSYYFSRDVLLALKANTPYTQERRGWLQFFLISLCSLSILQVAWLGQIFMVAQEELTKVGLL